DGCHPNPKVQGRRAPQMVRGPPQRAVRPPPGICRRRAAQHSPDARPKNLGADVAGQDCPPAPALLPFSFPYQEFYACSITATVAPARHAHGVSKPAKPIGGRRTELHVESLEDRLLLSTLNVNSTADILNPGPGVVTLRSAIQQANHTPGGNTINLTVPGT